MAATRAARLAALLVFLAVATAILAAVYYLAPHSGAPAAAHPHGPATSALALPAAPPSRPDTPGKAPSIRVLRLLSALYPRQKCHIVIGFKDAQPGPLQQLRALGDDAVPDYILALSNRDGNIRDAAACMLYDRRTTSAEALNALVTAVLAEAPPYQSQYKCSTSMSPCAEALRSLAPEVLAELDHWSRGELDRAYTVPLLMERREALLAWSDALAKALDDPRKAPRALDEAVAALYSQTGMELEAARRSLARIGAQHVKLVGPLVRALSAPSGHQPRFAAKSALSAALVRIGTPAFDPAASKLSSADEAAKRFLLQTLDKIPAGDPRPYLGQLLRCAFEEPEADHASAIRLLQRAPAEAIAHAEPLLGSRDPHQVENALNVLCWCSGNDDRQPEDFVATPELNRLVPKLLELAASDDVDISTTAFYPLGLARPTDPRVPRFLINNIAMRGSGPRGGWIVACTMVNLPLMRPLPRNVVEAVIEFGLGHSDGEERASYCADIAMMGAEAACALPRLRQLAAGDPDKRARLAAAKAIQHIEAGLARNK